MYVRGYLQGSENGRVVTIGRTHAANTFRRIRSLCLLEIDKAETKIAYGGHVC